MPNPSAAGAVIEITEAVDRRQQYVANLAGLGHVPTDAQPEPEVSQPSGLYDVRVNGTLLPVVAVAYEVVNTDAGPAVTITLPASSVSVGIRPAPTTPEGRAARTWSGNRPDPREGIPGWTPEVVQ